MADTEREGRDRARGGNSVSDDEGRSQISRLFDIRIVIGALLAVYGVILLVKGALDSGSTLDRTRGLRINLWTGIGLLVVGLLFLLWVKLSPLEPPSTEEVQEGLREEAGRAGRLTGA